MTAGGHAGEDGAVPIEDYGLLGDTRTAALVAPDGSIDWLCVPRFDGPTLFGRLVGGQAAGAFRLGPARPSAVMARRYRRCSATLETTWDAPGGRLTLTEGMVAELGGRLFPSTLLVRRLAVEGGPVEAVVEFDPRLGEDRRRPRSQQRGPVLVCQWRTTAVALQANPPLAVVAGEPTTITITPDLPLTFALSVAEREPLIYVEPAAAWAVLEADERRWQHWCDGIDPRLPWRDAVVRSLLTLRLLTYSPSGAAVAGPSTSLPEEVGGERNWDYRYAWPPDASIGIGAFLGVGKVEEARRFMAWLLHATRLDRPRLRVLLTVNGGRPPPEHQLAGWPGYARSLPVRAGNDAADLHQLDGYGWVLDAAWLLTRAGERLYSETWRAVAGFADTVAAHWREPHAGIWEIRGDRAHHVHSNRALRIAPDHRVSARRRRRWAAERDALASEIRGQGFDAARGTFTRTYGSADLDAALIILPLLGIEPPGSPRVQGTLDAIRRELEAGGPLLYRYPPGRDGLAGAEGAFLACSFWLAHALAVAGKVDEASEIFDGLVSLARPLGLFAEEMDPATGRQLGNYPQALTHAALAVRDASAAPDKEEAG